MSYCFCPDSWVLIDGYFSIPETHARGYVIKRDGDQWRGCLQMWVLSIQSTVTCVKIAILELLYSKLLICLRCKVVVQYEKKKLFFTSNKEIKLHCAVKMTACALYLCIFAGSEMSALVWAVRVEKSTAASCKWSSVMDETLRYSTCPCCLI